MLTDASSFLGFAVVTCILLPIVGKALPSSEVDPCSNCEEVKTNDFDPGSCGKPCSVALYLYNYFFATQ